MKYIFITIFLFLLASCKQQKMNSVELCKKLSIMYKKDQLYRSDDRTEDPFFKVFDSVRKKDGISKSDYMKFSKEKQLKYGNRIREIVNKMGLVNQKIEDSLMILQRSIDSINTKELLAMIKQNGFPSIKELGCESYAAPFLIFVHSPENYWQEIEIMINDEKKNGRLTKGDYDYIMWHLKGRIGSPFE